MNFNGYRCDQCSVEVREPEPKWFGIDVASETNEVAIVDFDPAADFHLCSVKCVLAKLQYGILKDKISAVKSV